MKNDYPTKEVIVCDCFSIEHQLSFTYVYGDDETDYDVMNLEVHLISYDSFWKRLRAGIKYIFGHKSIYGEWDNFIVKREDCDKFISYFQKLKDDELAVQAKQIEIALANANVSGKNPQDQVLPNKKWTTSLGGELTSTQPLDTTTN